VPPQAREDARQENEVTDSALAGIAYCGLSCAVCSHSSEGCKVCRAGGGPEQCNKRDCCVGKRLDGCWQCDSFPCGDFFADEAWTGLCIGCIRVIQEKGVEAFAGLVRSQLGDSFDYGHLRFRKPEEIKKMLGDSGA
jgi:hypothetical protein